MNGKKEIVKFLLWEPFVKQLVSITEDFFPFLEAREGRDGFKIILSQVCLSKLEGVRKTSEHIRMVCCQVSQKSNVFLLNFRGMTRSCEPGIPLFYLLNLRACKKLKISSVV